MPSPSSALIVSGPPGAGKSTIARLLVEAHDGVAVHLPADEFWHFVRSGGIAPYRPEAYAHNRIVVEAVAAAAAAYVAGGLFVVIDGVIGPGLIPPFARALPGLDYVVLRPSLADAPERAGSRREGGLRSAEAIESLYRQFQQLGRLESHVIDNSREPPAASAARVGEALSAGRLRLEPWWGDPEELRRRLEGMTTNEILFELGLLGGLGCCRGRPRSRGDDGRVARRRLRRAGGACGHGPRGPGEIRVLARRRVRRRGCGPPGNGRCSGRFCAFAPVDERSDDRPQRAAAQRQLIANRP